MENKKKSKIGSGGELLTCSGESCAVFGVNFKKRKPTSKHCHGREMLARIN